MIDRTQMEEYSPELQRILDIEGDTTPLEHAIQILFVSERTRGKPLTEEAAAELAALVAEREALRERVKALTCPECDSRICDDGNCMMGHWCGKPGV